jgi:putative acetyltransferase
MQVVVTIETPKQAEVIHLLELSVEYIRSLYPEEHAHSFNMRELTRPRARFFVARSQGKAMGIAAYVPHGRLVVELKHMFIDAACRGMGCGRKLLAFIEQTAITDGVRKIVLETSLKQADAIGLYRAFGYMDCLPYTEHHAEDVFMSKRL